MPAKGKNFYIHLDFDVEITVPSGTQEVFLTDIQRGEISLFINVLYGDGGSRGMSLYPDSFKSGSFALLQIKENKFKVQCHGMTSHKIDPSFDKELLVLLKKRDLEVVPKSVGNSNCDSVDIDSDNEEFRGRCSLE